MTEERCPIHPEVALDSKGYCHKCDDYTPLPHEEAFPA